MIDFKNRIFLFAFLLEICGVALAYYWLYDLNEWIFTSFSFTREIDWIFLPAAIRIITVLLFGWRAVIGLFIGTFSTCHFTAGTYNIDAYYFSTFSSLLPMLAVIVGVYFMKTKADLAGLTAKQLLVFGLLGATFNAMSHNLYFQFTGSVNSWLTGVVPMFVGDMVGTMIVLFFAAALLRYLPLPTIERS